MPSGKVNQIFNGCNPIIVQLHLMELSARRPNPILKNSGVKLDFTLESTNQIFHETTFTISD